MTTASATPVQIPVSPPKLSPHQLPTPIPAPAASSTHLAASPAPGLPNVFARILTPSLGLGREALAPKKAKDDDDPIFNIPDADGDHQDVASALSLISPASSKR